MDTRIYVMTHKKIEQICDSMYLPMQVGKAGKQSFGYIGDDTGDNISEKNSMYCELTGMYWLWKNVSCDVIGICHYRRYFIKDKRLLDQAYIEKLIRKYPIIIPNSSCVNEADVSAHYGKKHFTGDLDFCRTVILEKYPEYLKAFDFAMHTILFSTGNMWITRKDIFDRYCEWLFDILFEVEKRIDLSGYNDYQKRVMGFLAERLFRVWLFMQPEAVTEEEIKMIEPSDFLNTEKRVDLLYRCVKLKVDPVLRLYRNGVQGIFEQSFVCADDFKGKIPVWVCWWQGEAEMPELIRLCIASLKENLPQEKMEIRLITLENCLKYVTFTETVIRKFQEGKISYTHLSDLLRAELLYRYGGMWIDAAYYTAKPIEKTILDHQLYTLRFKNSSRKSEIVQGRWSGDLWYAPKGKKLFQFLMECFWYYWETSDELIDHCLMDYLIAAAVEEFPDVRNELEACEYCENNVFELEKWMNRRFFPERMNALLALSCFHKLNWQADYRKENMAGEKTVYGKISE